jgi:hypothetical protein
MAVSRPCSATPTRPPDTADQTESIDQYGDRRGLFTRADRAEQPVEPDDAGPHPEGSAQGPTRARPAGQVTAS